MDKFLTENEVLDLRTRHRDEKDGRQRDKIKTILMLNDGYTYAEISNVNCFDNGTGRNYFTRFSDGGIENLLQDNYNGRKSFLTEEQIEELGKHLDENIYPNTKEISEYIEKTYGVIYSAEGLRDLLKRKEFKYKKTKHIPSKGNRDDQEKFLDGYDDLRGKKDKSDRIYHLDGTHPLHNSQPGFGWIRKGITKFIKANTGRKRVNINGAYDAENRETVFVECDSVNSQSTIELLVKIMMHQPFGLIYIILDNAAYYRSALVKDFLAKNQRIKFMFLPPYSPNLNLIERLWKLMKKKVTRNKYYENFADFKSAIINFFDNLSDYDAELETLMTNNFQLYAA